MANYLPVLLVSVNTNTMPDDNALTTMPRGQVDYLSHDWQEEDVWRSWRNMTRQKNEITNGIRLENASWRTWWKQRNKLKTISPETLNWLKDSDVTWLYGPLHTAVEWTPPPKPQAIPDSVDSGNPASTHDRLDLHSGPPSAPRRPQPPRTKPILKHRSISELLTSELPVSPIFSPHDSESDSNHTQSLDILEDTEGLKRPALVHTKSDSHITRWGPSRVFRKDSPPRVPPPSSSIIKSSSRNSTSTIHASGAVRNSLSQDSASSASGSSERTSKRKHITFNTFVEQCIAIDKHPRSRKGGKLGLSGYPGQSVPDEEEEEGQEEEDGNYDEKWEDDDGYEEDREDNLFDEDDPLWLAAHGGAHPRRRHLNGSAIHSDSDSDDDAIEIRPSSYRHTNLATPTSKKKLPPRSISVSSSSSATTTSTSASSSAGGPPSRQRRKSASYATSDKPLTHLLSPPPQHSAYRPRIPSVQSDPSQRDRVTIAPIAPTLLKTTGAWEEGFGDECGTSDDGLWDYGVAGHGVNETSGGSSNKKGMGARDEEDQSSEGTPVELVYVPPFGSIYGYGAGTYWRPRGAPDAELDEEAEEEDAKEVEAQVISSNQPQESTAPPTTSTSVDSLQPSNPTSPIPIVVVDSNAASTQSLDDTHDKLDKVVSVESSPSSISTTTGPVLIPRGGRHQIEEEKEQGRGRDTSVSPVGLAHSSKPLSNGGSGSSGGLLVPRSRSQSCQDLQSFYTTSTPSSQGNERRGRSNQRGSSGSGNGSSSGSRRGLQSSRSSQGSQSGRPGGSVSPNNNNITSSSSPVGESISPDSSDSRLGGIGNAYAGGRMGGRERERVERVSSSSSLSSKATAAGGGSDERRGRDRGRRVIGSESGSSTSPIPNCAQEESRERGRGGRGMGARTGASLSPQETFDVEPVALSQGSAVMTEVKGKSKEPITLADESVGFVSDTTQSVELDASIYSVSSEGSTATIVPTSPTILPGIPAFAVDVPLVSVTGQRSERGVIEEAEDRRKTAPTPSNSPNIFMTAPQAKQSEDGTTTPTAHPPPTTLPPPALPRTPEQIRTVSDSPTHSRSSKLKTSPNVPIVPSPPHPALPSTSASYAPGEVSPSAIFTAFGPNGRDASSSLERASSGSRERYSSPSSPSPTVTLAGSGLKREITEDLENERELAEARRGRNNAPGVGRARCLPNVSVDVHKIAGAGPKEPTSPITSGHKERETIIDKAVGMMSSAGAYLKLWPNHNDVKETPS